MATDNSSLHLGTFFLRPRYAAPECRHNYRRIPVTSGPFLDGGYVAVSSSKGDETGIPRGATTNWNLWIGGEDSTINWTYISGAGS
jgi:hypothetical protein